MASNDRHLWSGLADRLMPRAARVGRWVAPAARLARVDMALLRAWTHHVVAVDETLGAAEARAYTDLVIATGLKDTEVGRLLAHTLPDHLARVPPQQRGRYLSLLRAVLAEQAQALPLLVRTLPDLLGRMDDPSLSRYISQGLALHRDSTRKAESFFKLESGRGQRAASELCRGTALTQVHRTLALYARAHCGEDVQVRPTQGDQSAFTDGRHIYLPPEVTRFGDRRDFLVYRVLTARNAGFLEFGTMDLDLDRLPGAWPDRREGEVEVERLFRAFANVSLARDLFGVLEGRRVEQRVRAEYPGVARDMDALAEAWRPERRDLAELSPAEQVVEALARVAAGEPTPELAGPVAQAFAQALAALDRVSAADATVETTVAALSAIYPAVDALMARAEPSGERQPHRGSGRGHRRDPSPRSPDTPRATRAPEREDDLHYRPRGPDPLQGELRPDALGSAEREVEERAHQLLRALRDKGRDIELADARRAARRRDGASYEEMEAFLDRMPAPAGPMRDRIETDGSDRPMLPELSLDTSAAVRAGTWLYPEWDHAIEDYKPRWVRVSELVLRPGDAGFVDGVLRKHGHHIARLRRAFEALRPEAVARVRGLTDGDEIDIDRAIQARLERRAGGAPTDRIYTRHRRDARDVAVAFLVDMSSSTNEVSSPDGKRIIDVEKEALVLIAEAVDAIGDTCAIYGFSGYGRDQVAFYVAKDFDDPFDRSIRERIGRIAWKMENRDGAAIRHATARFDRWPARVKLLVLLSDGKPLDCGCDHYADRYAQEDTRAALREARRKGIHPFCITVDPHGNRYLSRMYGDHGYTVIDRVEALPHRLPRIYRRLTR